MRMAKLLDRQVLNFKMRYLSVIEQTVKYYIPVVLQTFY